MRRIAIVVMFAVLAASAGRIAAAPEPHDATSVWQLKFEFHDVQRIDLVLPGDRTPTAFWYLLYTVTNNSDRDVEFYPTFELVTDEFQVVVGGDDISPSVISAISARHKKVYPFLRDPGKVSGKLLQGQDNARSSVAVFRDFRASASEFRVYVAGLSGEVVRMSNPAFDADKDESPQNLRFFTLRKSLEIAYDLPGDESTRNRASPVRKDQRWVMR